MNDGNWFVGTTSTFGVFNPVKAISACEFMNIVFAGANESELIALLPRKTQWSNVNNVSYESELLDTKFGELLTIKFEKE